MKKVFWQIFVRRRGLLDRQLSQIVDAIQHSRMIIDDVSWVLNSQMFQKFECWRHESVRFDRYDGDVDEHQPRYAIHLTIVPFGWQRLIR